jgi:hypothetical protein
MKCPNCTFVWRRLDVSATLPIHDCSHYRGPGAELHYLILRWFKQDFIDRCGCKSYVAKMNAWGVEGCQRRIDRIARKLFVEAGRRGLLKSRFLCLKSAKRICAKRVCERLVKRAIWRAEKQD